MSREFFSALVQLSASTNGDDASMLTSAQQLNWRGALNHYLFVDLGQQLEYIGLVWSSPGA